GAQTESKPFAKVINQVKDDVEAGNMLHDAARKHPKIFTELYCSMLQAGEIAGILDTILPRLAAHLAKAAKLQSKIKGAMIYPACIVGAAVLVTTILLIWVIPVFAEVFSSFGKALPVPTQFVINLSNFVKAYILYLAMVPIAAGVGLKYTYATER